MPSAIEAVSGWVDLADRFRLRAEGEQSRWFFDQLVTQKVDDLPDGHVADALLLTPKGRISSMLRLSHVEGQVFVDAAPASTVEPFEFFSGRVFATRTSLTDLRNSHTLVGLRGPGSTEAMRELLEAEDPQDHGSDAWAVGEVVVVKATTPVAGFDLLIANERAEGIEERLSAIGFPRIDPGVWRSMHAYSGAPVYGVDIDETFLPQEASMERMVHFAKGCYLGQEAVAMTQRGRVKRKVRRIVFDDTPALGEVFHDGVAVGLVSSYGMFDGAAGIATVSTSVGSGAKVTVGPDHLGAIVEPLPGSVDGPSVPSARELRERLEGSR